MNEVKRVFKSVEFVSSSMKFSMSVSLRAHHVHSNLAGD